MNNDGRDSIEWRLRRILQNYQAACSTGDFKDAVLGVHTALEDAIDLELGPEARDWPFSQKFQQLFPELCEQYGVDELNRQRNHYAHPKRVFEEEETRQMAAKFVELAIRVWKPLFHTQPPEVASPAPPSRPGGGEERSGVGAQDGQKPARRMNFWGKVRGAVDSRFSRSRDQRQAASPAGYIPFFRLPWISLYGGIVLIVISAMLAGLIAYSFANHLPGAWYWIALPATLALAAAYFAGRGFWRFLRSLGLRRLVVGVAGGGLAAILILALLAPSALGWEARLAGAAVQVGDGARLAGWKAMTSAFEWGRKIAKEQLAPLVYRLAALGPREELEANASIEPTPTSQEAGAVNDARFRIGAKVKVRTDGTRLRGRAAAGINAAVAVFFSFGEELSVADGPVQADGYTWWKVQGKTGSGWSAENYLVLIP